MRALRWLLFTVFLVIMMTGASIKSEIRPTPYAPYVKIYGICAGVAALFSLFISMTETFNASRIREELTEALKTKVDDSQP
jgi:hypothetical protein